MNATEAGQRLRRLVFQWPGQSVSFAFPMIFVGVVVLHALTFYGFQVVYPPVSSVSPPPGEVMLITADTPANQALLEWVDAQSPALAPRLQDQPPQGLERVDYKPSYLAVQTLPKAASAVSRETVFPAAYDAATLLNPRRPKQEVRGQAVQTSLRFSGALSGRVLHEGALSFQQRSDGGLLPTVFLIGVGEHGRVLYAFLQESSGSPAMDAEAESAVRQLQFAAQSGPVAWGLATFAWGGDAMASPSRPASPQEGGEG